MLTFNFRFFLAAFVLFVIEVLIALYVRDRFVRPYVGDFLVVIMIYCFVRAFLKAPALKIGIAVLIFACLIEVLQFFNIVDRLGLTENAVAKTVIGYGFEWFDILAYTLGIATVLVIENLIISRDAKITRNNTYS